MLLKNLMRAGIVDEDDKRVLDEIGLIEQNCSDFHLRCKETDGKWGIWLNINDCVLPMTPKDLTSSIYNDVDYYSPIYFGSNRYGCEIHIRKTDYSYEFICFCPEISMCRILRFRFADYSEKTTQAIFLLKQAIADGHKSIYRDNDVSDAVLEICLRQLQIKALLPSHARLMSEGVLVEEFVFQTTDEKEDLYRIGIGNRTYQTWFTRWDNSPDKIRHNLESLLYNAECDIDIMYDTSPTKIQVQLVNILDKITKIEEGTTFSHKQYAKVQILSNEFADMPVVVGYCDKKQFVRTLYEGLLSLALQYPIVDEYDDGDGVRFDAYLGFKSPMIEDYIKGEERNDEKVYLRDSRVKQVIEICPSIDTWGHSLMEDVPPFDIDVTGELCLDEVCDKMGEPIVMPELYAWQREIEPIIIASETGKPYQKDWADYHKRGLTIAHTLREALPDNYDLWYAPPFEDKSGTIQHKMLIF